jgi:CBS domain-containing protein
MAVYHVGESRGSVYRSGGAPFTVVVDVPVAGEHARCPRRGDTPLDECEDCPWLRQPGADRLHCVMSGREPVSSWMTAAARVPMTARTQSRLAALAEAVDAGAHHLLVLDDERVLVGIVCCCDLVGGAAPTVGGCMPPDVYVTGPATSLSEALSAMRSFGISSLPIVDGPLVLGVITRADLVRAGAPGADERWHRACTR